MIPSVNVNKSDGNTGVVAPSSQGILAIIAPCEKGPTNQPSSVTKPNSAVSTHGFGELTEFGAYVMAVARKPVVLVRGSASTPGTYGAVDLAGTGSSDPSAGVSAPLDAFDVVVKIVHGGTRGTEGITYTYSLDGGVNTSPVQALGAATSIVIPNSGVQIALSAGTLDAGDVITVKTVAPQMSVADVSTALEALRVSQLGWEMALVGGHAATSNSVQTLDGWLYAREGKGRFQGFLCNARMKNAGESEADYLAAMTTAWASTASIRGCVGADGGDVVSQIPGRAIVQKRPTALALAARLMAKAYGVDAAYVNDGPLLGFGLADAQGNPRNHDEALFPGLDDLRLATLRSFDRRPGTYINNPNVISPAGSDYVWAQHLRCMNRACELAYDVITGELSRGVETNPKPGPTGQIYIADDAAQAIDDLVNAALNELRGQVTDLRFALSRTDDIGSNGVTTLTGGVRIAPLKYAKRFDVTASFTRSISVSA